MKYITITPVKTVNLSHRAYYFRNRRDEFFASCSREGIVTLIDTDFNIKNVFNCSETIKRHDDCIHIFALHPFINIFCIGSEDEYRIYDFSGKPICSIQERIESVYYSEVENLAWMVKRISSKEKEICLIIDDLQRDSIVIEDEMDESHVEFSPLPESNKICMIFMAGQNGMMTYFLTNENNKIKSRYIGELDEGALLDFNEDKNKFITVDPYGLDKMTIYSYPSLDVSAEFLLPERCEENECVFGYSSLYIDNKYAITEIGEDLYYILDTENMEISARFVVEGHEPKPIVEYCPKLNDEKGETTNLSHIYKSYKYLIAPFKAMPTDKYDNSLVVLRRNDVKEKIKEILK